MVYILKINILYLVPFRSSLVYYIHYQSNRTPATSGRGKGQRRGLMLEMKFHLFSFLLPPQITVIFLYDSFHTFLGEEGPSILDRLNLLKSRQKNLSLSSSTLPHMIPVRQKYWIHLSKMYILPKVCVCVCYMCVCMHVTLKVYLDSIFNLKNIKLQKFSLKSVFKKTYQFHYHVLIFH